MNIPPFNAPKVGIGKVGIDVTDASQDSPPGEGHLSDFALDILVSSSATQTITSVLTYLSQPSSSGAEVAHLKHIKQCAACHARLTLLCEASMEAAPTVARLMALAASEAAQEGGLSWWRRTLQAWQQAWQDKSAGLRWAGVSTSLALSVAVAFAVWPAPSGDHPDNVHSLTNDVIRTKGTAVRFFVKRGDDVKIGRSGDIFLEGDSLRFVVTSGAPSNLLLFGIEADGQVSAYFPFGGDASRAVDVGAEIPLAGSLILDSSTTTEFIGAVFSPDPIALDSVAVAVQSSLEKLKREGRSELRLDDIRALDLPGALHWIELRRNTNVKSANEREGVK